MANSHIDSEKGSKLSGKSSTSPERVIARLKRDNADPEHPDRDKAGFLLARPRGGANNPDGRNQHEVNANNISVDQELTNEPDLFTQPTPEPSKPLHPGRRYTVTLRLDQRLSSRK